MGEFSSIIGFIMFFSIMIFTVSAGVLIYQKNLVEQASFSNQFLQESPNNPNYNFNITNIFFSSGRLNFKIYNSGSKVLKIANSINSNSCFNFFINNNFFSNNLTSFHINKSFSTPYFILEPKRYGNFLILNQNFKNISNNDFKLISCRGIEKNIKITALKLNWWNSSFLKKKIISLDNLYSKSLENYQVQVNLNYSNFDFTTNYNQNNIRFVSKISNFEILDLTFDNYSQKIKDYSPFSNSVFLGSNSTIQISDPKQTKGVIFSGVNFNGKNSFIDINASKNLEINKSLTYSAWVKWTGKGDSLQNIFTNGIWSNALRIVNDNSANQGKILFQLSINSVTNYLYSNETISKNQWNFITSTYNGKEMKLYINGILVGKKTIFGLINSYYNINKIGSEYSNYFFNGSIDEVKIFDIALKQNEVISLMNDNLHFINLDYYISKWDAPNLNAKIFVKIPFVMKLSNTSFQMYYNPNYNLNSSNSNIITTFSYISPKIIGYLVSSKAPNGLNVLSLSNNNTIQIGTSSINLNFSKNAIISSGNLKIGDSVNAIGLANVEGNSPFSDMIVPVSWASNNFYFSGFRASINNICMLSPWGNSNVNVYISGILNWSGTINKTGLCKGFSLSNSKVLSIKASIPILVSSFGSGGTHDSFAWIPPAKDLYGVPSQSYYISSGINSAKGTLLFSNGNSINLNLASYSRISGGGNGGNGNAPSLKVSSNKNISSIQQADGDGTESSVFAPLSQMGTLFGSSFSADYVAVTSPYPNANCSVYSNNLLIENIQTGTGANGIYEYLFGVGNNNILLNSNWYLKCDKLVWPYYEKHVTEGETNLFGYLQMKQYVYPSPKIIIN